MRGHKRNCRCCRSAACSLLLLLLLSCWLPAATPASPPSFSAAAAHLLASALSLCLFLFSSLLPVFSLLLVLALYGAAAAGVAGCWGDCLLLLVLPRALLLLLPASPPPPASPSPSPSPLPWLLLLCRGCSAGAGKGNQRHLYTAKEQTGTRLSTKKRKVRQRISFSCSFVGRALYWGRGEQRSNERRRPALREERHEGAVLHEGNEIQNPRGGLDLTWCRVHRAVKSRWALVLADLNLRSSQAKKVASGHCFR